MNIIYRLRKPNGEKSPLRLKINYGKFKVNEQGKKIYQPFETDLPLRIPTALWDKETRRLKKNRTYEHTDGINAILAKLESGLADYELECKRHGTEIDAEGILTTINTIIAPQDNSTPKYFTDLIQEVILKSQAGERLSSRGQHISPATIRKYKIALAHIEDFEEQHGDITLGMLNKALGDRIQVYFNDMGHAHNSKADMLKQYIMFYNYAVASGYIQPTDFHRSRLPDIPADAIALTQEEVDTIYQLNLQDDRTLDQVRDVFIVGIWTLMRFGDYSNIKEYNVQDDHIVVITEKTNDRVLLPLHWQVADILKKYDNRLPAPPTQQTFNGHLKNLAKLAGLNKPEEIRVEKGGKVRKIIKQRWELVSTHTARRTGATLLYLDGITKKEIMLLTGHKREDTFDRYVKVGKYATVKKLSQRGIYQKAESMDAAKEFSNGFYWVRKKHTTTIARVHDGLLEFMGSRTISIDTWLEQGGEFLVGLKEPK